MRVDDVSQSVPGGAGEGYDTFDGIYLKPY